MQQEMQVSAFGTRVHKLAVHPGQLIGGSDTLSLTM